MAARFMRYALLPVVSIATIMQCGGVAYAAAHQNWAMVGRIPAGTRVAIYRTGRGLPDSCDMLSADDSTVTCAPPDSDINPAQSARLIFPRASIREIDAFEETHDHHVGIWIASGVSAGLVIAAWVANPLGGVIVGVMLLGGWSAWADNHLLRPPLPGPGIRRRVIYRAQRAQGAAYGTP